MLYGYVHEIDTTVDPNHFRGFLYRPLEAPAGQSHRF